MTNRRLHRVDKYGSGVTIGAEILYNAMGIVAYNSSEKIPGILFNLLEFLWYTFDAGFIILLMFQLLEPRF